MKILSIDPGNNDSAFVIWDTDSGKITHKSDIIPGTTNRKTENNEMLRLIVDLKEFWEVMSIEIIENMGFSVGREIFDTAFWYGRFLQIAVDNRVPLENIVMCPRLRVQKEIGGKRGASDSEIVDKIIEMFGGKDVAIGGVKCQTCKGKGTVKKSVCPDCNGHPVSEFGIFYGMGAKNNDVWQAMASALFAKRLFDCANNAAINTTKNRRVK